MGVLFINGKFTVQSTTGVQRFACNLVQALDELQAPGAGRCMLLVPAGAGSMPLNNIMQRQIGLPGLPLHLWEQIVLPLASRDGLLVSLAGSAPAAARRQVAVLHDAAVFDRPEAYTRAFVGWYRWLFQHLAARAEQLLTVSDFSRQRLAASLGVDPSRLGLVPNGANHLDSVSPDESVLQHHQLQADRYLLAVSSENANKNLPALMSAFASLPVLFVTGYAGDIAEGTDFGGHEVLRKPYTLMGLSHALSNALSGSHHPGTAAAAE